VRLKVAKDVLKKMNDEHCLIARKALNRPPSNGEIIVHGFVKPIVKNQSYTSFLKNNAVTAILVGKINIFVSHAWSSSFVETVQDAHMNFLIQSFLFFRTLGMDEYMLKCSQLALKIAEDIGNEWGMARVKSNVALALTELGRFAKAVDMRKIIVEERTEKYGPEHDDTLTGRYLLGKAYMCSAQWVKAEIELRAVLKVYKEKHEPMHYEIRETQETLAQVLRDSRKDLDQAQMLFKELYDHKSKTFGSEDPTVLFTAVQHARCFDLKGHHEAALKTYNKAWPTILRTWGENDADVKMVRSWIDEAKSNILEKKE